jgi:hypothetical protein
MRIRAHRRRTRASAAARRDGVATKRAATRADGPEVKAQVTRLVVEVANRAQSWRDAALDAELAFRSWQMAARGERDAAAVTYLAAIEREEKAASEYSRASVACCATLPELRTAPAARHAGHRPRWRLSYDDS